MLGVFLLCEGRLMSMHVQEHFIELDYARIWCQIWSTQLTRHSIPIVFVHGGPGLESGYIANLNRLALQRPCIFYDQAGCGKSLLKPSAHVEYTLEHYAQELSLVIDALAYDSVILYGYSWGAALATHYAAHHPNRVEALILASPYLSTSHLLENYKTLAQSKGIYEILHAHEMADTTDSNEYKEAWALFFKSFIFSGDPTIFNHIIMNQEIIDIMWGNYEFSVTGTLRDLNLIALLPYLTMPVLLTSGRCDTMTPLYMQLLQRTIPASKWIMFEQSTHMPHREEQDLYCASINQFLEKVEN